MFNGKVYNSVDDLPEEYRKIVEVSGALADTNHDGVPDLLERAGEDRSGDSVTTAVIVIDGVPYKSVNDVPPKARAALQVAGLFAVQGSPTAPPAAAHPAQPAGEVLLNGVPVGLDGPPRRRRWWHRR